MYVIAEEARLKQSVVLERRDLRSDEALIRTDCHAPLSLAMMLRTGAVNMEEARLTQSAVRFEYFMI